jgi:hypothetical protein
VENSSSYRRLVGLAARVRRTGEGARRLGAGGFPLGIGDAARWLGAWRLGFVFFSFFMSFSKFEIHF